MYVLKKIWKKAVFQTKKTKHFQRPYLPKVSPTFLSPQHSTFNHYPSSPHFLKTKPNQQKKNTHPTELSRGFPPELQGHPASSSSNPSPSTSTFPRLRALSRPPVGLDPIAWWGGSREGGMEKFFFFGQAKGNGGTFLEVFLGFLRGNF